MTANDRVDIDDRMATARLRNTLNLKWPAIEYRLHGLGLNGTVRRIEAEEASSLNARIDDAVSVVPSHRITEVHKARNAEALADTIRRFLSAVEDVPVVSMLGLEGVLFGLDGMTASDAVRLTESDGNTVTVVQADLARWLVLDINVDEIEGRFYEVNVGGDVDR